MAKITSSQRAALEAAGYQIKGDTVQNKDGRTVAGYNSKGNLFSSGGKVRDILKSQGDTPKTATEKPARAPQAKKATSPTQKPQSRPKARPTRSGDVSSPRKVEGLPEKKSGDDTARVVAGTVGAAAAGTMAARALRRKPSGAGPSGERKPSSPSGGRPANTPARKVVDWKFDQPADAPKPVRTGRGWDFSTGNPAKTEKPRVKVNAAVSGRAVIKPKEAPKASESIKNRMKQALIRSGGAGMMDVGGLDDMNKMQLPLIPQYAKGGLVKRKGKC